MRDFSQIKRAEGLFFSERERESFSPSLPYHQSYSLTTEGLDCFTLFWRVGENKVIFFLLIVSPEVIGWVCLYMVSGKKCER